MLTNSRDIVRRLEQEVASSFETRLTSRSSSDERNCAHAGMTAWFVSGKAPYALAMSGKTASILVFNVAALNGLTM